MNKHGRRAPQPVVLQRRKFALMHSYEIKDMKVLLDLVNQKFRLFGTISRRQLFYDLKKAKEDLYNKMTYEEKKNDLALKNAHLARIAKLIENLCIHLAQREKEMVPFEKIKTLVLIYKMQMAIVRFRGWDLSKKDNYLVVDKMS